MDCTVNKYCTAFINIYNKNFRIPSPDKVMGYIGITLPVCLSISLFVPQNFVNIIMQLHHCLGMCHKLINVRSLCTWRFITMIDYPLSNLDTAHNLCIFGKVQTRKTVAHVVCVCHIPKSNHFGLDFELWTPWW